LPTKEVRTKLCKEYGCTDEEAPASIGNGIFLIHSCLNHSCKPNAEVVGGLADTNDTQIKVVALRNIKKGEEITISYIEQPNKKDVAERRKELKGTYLFQCNCEKCLNEA
jgi:SET domain-containing protein